MENNEEKKEIVVGGQVAFNIKLLEFDKKIAELEAQTADIKRQRSSFVYDAAVSSAIADHNSNKNK
jgi:hypothetical protein